MKRRTTILIAALAALASLSARPPVAGAPAATSVAFAKTRVAGVYINLVTVNLNDQNVRLTPAIAQDGIGSCESFRSILRRTRPAAAINGTFFCTKTFKPTGDIVIDGQFLAKGSVGTVVGIGPGNKVTFLPNRADLYRWWEFDHVLVAGPALIMRGKTVVVPKAQGFKSGVHFSKRKRSAIGLTSKGKLVLVTAGNRVYLRQLARVMQTLGCTDAAALDGGSSAGLYWKGKLIVNPVRGLTNCLLVYDNPRSYEAHRSCFYPVVRYTQGKASGG